MEITTEKILREEIKELTAELDEAKSELEHALEKWRIAHGTAMERKKKIEKLEKKLEEVDVDFIRVVHAREVERLQEILDACELANFTHLQRIDQLEQLCRDMYFIFGIAAVEHEEYGFASIADDFKPRMEQLGLLEEKNEEAR